MERCGVLNIASGKKELLNKINEVAGTDLAAVEEMLFDCIASDSQAMQDVIRHVFRRPGKRLRPALVLLTGSLYPSKNENVLKVATAAELIHTASLIHDDIIDSSSWRRNQPSVNASYGNRPAVLAGDYLFARAFEMIALCEHVQLFRSFSRVVSVMCEGEMEQARHLFNLDRTKEEYLHDAYRKTAALMETCCGAGARLSGLDIKAIESLEHYGRNLGMAFQLIDDLLDIAGDSLVMGKPANSDIREGIITLPYIYLMEGCLAEQWIREKIERRDFSAIRMEFFQHDPSKLNDPLKRTLLDAEGYVKQARQNLSQFAVENHQLDGDVLDTLDFLAEYIISSVSTSVR